MKTASWARLLAAMVLAAGLSGCLKLKQNFLLMPDGSGKMTFFFAIKANEGMGAMGEMDNDFQNPEQLAESSKGIVAMSKPKIEDKDGWKHITLTAYFEDINKVKLLDKNSGKTQQSFTFKEKDNGYVFESEGSIMSDMPGMGGGMPGAPPPGGEEGEMDEQMKKMMEQMAKQMEEMFKKMFEGMEITMSVSLPGPVTSIEGYANKEGRTASFSVTGEDLQNQDKSKDLKKSMGKLMAVCGPADLSAEDQAAFKKELENAKAEWEEMKKAWESKKSEGEGKGESEGEGGGSEE